MNLASAIEGGITGATTLTLLQEAVGKIDPNGPGSDFLRKPGLLKKIKKQSKKGKYPAKLYIQLATELLSSAASYGISAIGKKKNTVLRGGLLGAAAGIGSVIFNYNHDEKPEMTRDDLLRIALTIALYTSGGLVAGAAVKKLSKRKKQRRKK